MMVSPSPSYITYLESPPLCKQALRQVKESNRSRQRHKLGTRQNSFGLIRRAYTVPQWKDARKEAVDKRYCIQAIPLWARGREKNDIWGIRRVRPLKQAAGRLYSKANYSAVCKKPYIKILMWLRGFLVIFLYLVWFSLSLSLLWELRDNEVMKNFQFVHKASEPSWNLIIKGQS